MHYLRLCFADYARFAEANDVEFTKRAYKFNIRKPKADTISRAKKMCSVTELTDAIGGHCCHKHHCVHKFSVADLEPVRR